MLGITALEGIWKHLYFATIKYLYKFAKKVRELKIRKGEAKKLNNMIQSHHPVHLHRKKNHQKSQGMHFEVQIFINLSCKYKLTACYNKDYRTYYS